MLSGNISSMTYMLLLITKTTKGANVLSHSNLKILQLIFGPMTSEPLAADELLSVRKFISAFFVKQNIKPNDNVEHFRVHIPE